MMTQAAQARRWGIGRLTLCYPEQLLQGAAALQAQRQQWPGAKIVQNGRRSLKRMPVCPTSYQIELASPTCHCSQAHAAATNRPSASNMYSSSLICILDMVMAAGGARRSSCWGARRSRRRGCRSRRRRCRRRHGPRRSRRRRRCSPRALRSVVMIAGMKGENTA